MAERIGEQAVQGTSQIQDRSLYHYSGVLGLIILAYRVSINVWNCRELKINVLCLFSFTDMFYGLPSQKI
jgi:hypothetical protein